MTIDRGPVVEDEHHVWDEHRIREARRLLRWLWVQMPHGVPASRERIADPEYDARLLREEGRP